MTSTRPNLFTPVSVNHMLPSGPVVMASGWLPETVNKLYSAIDDGENGSRRPTLLASRNQIRPSGPAVMPLGPELGVGMSNSVIVYGAPGRILPMRFPAFSVNQRFPSGPWVI